MKSEVERLLKLSDGSMKEADEFIQEALDAAETPQERKEIYDHVKKNTEEITIGILATY